MLRVRPGRMGEAFDPADERLFLRPSPFALRPSPFGLPLPLRRWSCVRIWNSSHYRVAEKASMRFVCPSISLARRMKLRSAQLSRLLALCGPVASVRCLLGPRRCPCAPPTARGSPRGAFDAARVRVATLLLWGDAAGGPQLRLPANCRRRCHPEPRRRRPATHPGINRRQQPRPQIHRKRLTHPCWPPHPASILNQICNPCESPATHAGQKPL